MNNVSRFSPGVAEPLYALEVAYCRGSRWHATRRMLEKTRNRARWSWIVTIGAAGVLLPVQLSV